MAPVAESEGKVGAGLAALVAGTDWEQGGADTRQWTHDLHRYSGKYIPQIARSAIELLSAPGDLVLDPYVGSGTTVLEAGLCGREAIGIDLNPLAVLIATAKVTEIDRQRLDQIEELVGAAAACAGGAGQGDPRGGGVPPRWRKAVEADARLNDPWFEKWFDADVLRDLLLIDVAVEALPDEDQRALGRVALSNVLRKLSRAHSGYPNVMLDRRKPSGRADAGKAFIASLRRCVAMVAELPLLSGLTVELGDATRLPLTDASVDAVVTHPPYIGSVPYAEYGLISLKWFGHDPRQLDERLTGGRRQRRDVVERFEQGYAGALVEAHRVLKPGRGMFLMVGNPVVRGTTVDLAAMSRRLAADAGFELLAEAERVGTNRRANKMGAEALLFFAKR